MKKTEAISILATSVRPREAKDRARYDEAVKMAIEALRCSEIPNSSDDTISRQAAIEALARMMPRSYTPDGSHPADEEIFRAQEVFADCIEALEILPSAQPEILACGEGELNVPDTNVGDMISRQAAIDAIDVLCQEHRYKIPGKRETYSQYNEAWQDALDRAEGAIFNLPTVQPDHNADVSKKVTDEDCISRRVAIELCDRYDNPSLHDDLEKLPSAQPEQVCVANVTLTDEQVKEVVEKAKNAVISVIELEPHWIPCSERLPDDLAEVNVTWVNHEPEPYYESIKSKPFTASAVYYEGNWYWYSSVCADVLAEYGRNDVDKVDDTIEITAWKPLPEPYRGGGE